MKLYEIAAIGSISASAIGGFRGALFGNTNITQPIKRAIPAMTMIDGWDIDDDSDEDSDEEVHQNKNNKKKKKAQNDK